MQLSRLVPCVAAIIALAAGSSRAALNLSTYPDQATWAGSPILQTTTTPQASATVNSAPASMGIANQAVAQIFTPTSTFTLDKLTIYAAGGPVTGASLHLFALNVGYPAAGWPSTGGYSPGGANGNGIDLFGGGAGLTFNYFGTPTQNYVDFDLTGADEVVITPGKSYAVELWAPAVTTASAMFWRRGADFYVDGNIYGGTNAAGYSNLTVSRNDLVGGRRDGALALYAVVPEPASFSLLGLAAVGMLARRRRVG